MTAEQTCITCCPAVGHSPQPPLDLPAKDGEPAPVETRRVSKVNSVPDGNGSEYFVWHAARFFHSVKFPACAQGELASTLSARHFFAEGLLLPNTKRFTMAHRERKCSAWMTTGV